MTVLSFHIKIWWHTQFSYFHIKLGSQTKKLHKIYENMTNFYWKFLILNIEFLANFLYSIFYRFKCSSMVSFCRKASLHLRNYVQAKEGQQYRTSHHIFINRGKFKDIKSYIRKQRHMNGHHQRPTASVKELSIAFGSS